MLIIFSDDLANNNISSIAATAEFESDISTSHLRDDDIDGEVISKLLQEIFEMI